ncbi:MAG TPA: DEAD/DEAH box helicase, partial [Bacteroidales bacterium]|nr:DEAD/DEAH box helicase [Bacteroidales bacterium]
KDLRKFRLNEQIAGQKYQIEAIQGVAEAFARDGSNGQLTGGARKALLVMATGSGKTRTAAAIVDMLAKCNWVKRALFLADRNALVTQAKNAFGEHLPQLSAIDLTKEREDQGTRLVFSTYPTMMNKIDELKTGEQRFYGTGHFDLIIIDEAHRSVYQKYGAIFRYFDALLIGLTATPKKDIDRNTYELFDIEDDNPTFAYELNQAVRDGFLVPPKAISVPIKFLREGIRYSELSEKEKAEYEEKFGDPTTGELPDEIGSEALNRWLFNTDTVDKVLQHLMKNGIRVEGGDKPGKTIIFAKNHVHAVFIEERFNKLYPEYAGKFLRVIDNYESKTQDLLEKFTDPFAEQNPQIAVSVDMLNTGVDALRVVNLVYFKMVKSHTKFWQMLGRGTRLCQNLFGPGDDKTHFLIFDFCQNLEFFEAKPEGIESNAIISLTQRIFNMKLDVAVAIRNKVKSGSDERELAEAYIHELHHEIRSLDQERFEVKMNLRFVIEYSVAARWQNLSKGDIIDISSQLSPLVLPGKEDDELARRFDILLLSLKLALLHGCKGSQYMSKLTTTAVALEKKQNIPAVNIHLALIREIQTKSFWEKINVKRLEEVRLALRELIKFLDAGNKHKVYTNLEDEIFASQVAEKSLVEEYTRMQSYKERVESYIRKNKHHIAIHKLRTNVPITAAELQELERILFDGQQRGTRQDFVREYGDQPLGRFIRSIVGLDIKAAHAAFAEFLQAGNLKADQMTFINQIVMHLEQNGTIEAGMLFESPFTNVNDQGLLGVFDEATSTRIIQLIERINWNAGVG